MFCLCIEVAYYRQIRRLHPEVVKPLAERIHQLARDSGAELHGADTGRWLVLYSSLRTGDSLFVMENTQRFREILAGHQDDLTDFSFVLEVVDGVDDARRTMASLMTGIRESRGLWLGPQAIRVLGNLVAYTPTGKLGLVEPIERKAAPHRTMPVRILESHAPRDPLVERIRAAISRGGGLVLVEAERYWWTGSIVERALESLRDQGIKPVYWWIRGLDPQDNAAGLLWRSMKMASPGHVGMGFQYHGTARAIEAWKSAFGAAVREAVDRPRVLYLENLGHMPTVILDWLSSWLPEAMEASSPLVVIASQGMDLVDRFSTLPRTEPLFVPAGVGGNGGEGRDAHSRALMEYFNEDSLGAAISSLGPVEAEVLYVLYLCQNLLGMEAITPVLVNAGIEKIRIPATMQQLYDLALIRGVDEPVLVFPELEPLLEPLLGDRVSVLRAALIRHLEETVARSPGYVSLELFYHCGDLISDQVYVEWAISLGESLLDHGMLDDAQRLVDHLSARESQAGTITGNLGFDMAIQYLYARKVVLGDETQEVAEAHRNLRLHMHAKHWLRPFLLLQEARIDMAAKDMGNALTTVKQAIYEFQESSHVKQLAACHSLFAQILTGRDRPAEARDYLHLARIEATKIKDEHETMKTQVLDLLIQFVLGHFSGPLEQVDPRGTMVREAGTQGRHDLLMVYRYLRGRIQWELGAYAKAEEAFCEALEGATDPTLGPFTDDLLAWSIRTRLYAGTLSPQDLPPIASVSPGSNLALVLGEYLVSAGYHEQALTLCADIRDTPPRHPEYLVWGDLMYLPENLLFDGTRLSSTRMNLWDMIRGQALYHTGHEEDALTLFYHKTRAKAFSAHDPYYYQYLHQYSRLLRHAGPKAPEDGVTILGKAIKAFQERASKIENPNHKLQFIKDNRYNAEMMQEARQFNLA